MSESIASFWASVATSWSWLHVENLFVPAALRGRGLGTRILAMAEAEAQARGCVGARLAERVLEDKVEAAGGCCARGTRIRSCESNRTPDA